MYVGGNIHMYTISFNKQKLKQIAKNVTSHSGSNELKMWNFYLFYYYTAQIT